MSSPTLAKLRFALGERTLYRTARLLTEPPSLSQTYFTPSSSTSNIKVAFGGITPPAPRAP